MRRIFVILSSVFGILILTSIFLVFARSWVLSAILSSKFQTLVTVEQLTFSQGNQIDLAHLSIDNPDTFQSTHALEVQSIAITAPYREFFNTAIHIDTIALDGILITVDFVGKTTNWEVCKPKRLRAVRSQKRGIMTERINMGEAARSGLIV